mmetsp:Transcript_39339/g.80660  ORF Transcript_39339/g.80660 Transcript_39339/m.80660 type:complete len:447 (+) Transcript_39339:190-1530(+)
MKLQYMHLPATALAAAVASPLAAGAGHNTVRSPPTASNVASTARNAIRRTLTAARIYHRRQQQRKQQRKQRLQLLHRALQIDPSQIPDDFSMEDLQSMIDQAGVGDVDLGSLQDMLDSMGEGGDMGDIGDMGDLMGDMDLGDMGDMGDLESLLDEFGDMGGGDGDVDGDGDGNLFDFDSLFGGDGGDGSGGMDLTGLGGLICGFMSMVNDDPEMKDLGATCDCAADDDLVISCTVPGIVCDTPPDGEEEYCVENSSTVVTIPLDMSGADGGEEGVINASADSCGTYTGPALVAGKEFCFTADISMDLDDMMTSTEEEGGTTTEPDLSEMVQCKASLGDQTCDCVICDGGLGLKLDCPDVGLVSECTDIMDSAATGGGGGEGGTGAAPIMDGLPVSAQTAVVRFAKAQDEDSSPATRTIAAATGQVGAVVTAGTTLVVAIAAFTGHL